MAGEAKVEWMGRDTDFLNISTGFMQGILHFGSSVFHSIVQESIKIFSLQIWDDLVQATGLKQELENRKHLITMMQTP